MEPALASPLLLLAAGMVVALVVFALAAVLVSAEAGESLSPSLSVRMARGIAVELLCGSCTDRCTDLIQQGNRCSAW